MAWIRSDLMPIRDERSTYTIFYAPTDRPLTPVAEAAAARLLRVATAVIPANGGPLFGAWCLADTDLAVMLNRLVANGHDVPAVVRTYVEGQWARRSVRRWVERERPTYVPY
jgi:glutathione S-transferase